MHFGLNGMNERGTSLKTSCDNGAAYEDRFEPALTEEVSCDIGWNEMKQSLFYTS